jgi:hypothetical protein
MLVETSGTRCPSVVLLLTIVIRLFSWTRWSILVLFRTLVWFGIIHRIVIRTATSTIVHRSLILPTTTSKSTSESSVSRHRTRSTRFTSTDCTPYRNENPIGDRSDENVILDHLSSNYFHLRLDVPMYVSHLQTTTASFDEEPCVVTYPHRLHRCPQNECLSRFLKLFSRFRRFQMRTFDVQAHF